ncbi:hypothetical protein POM88_018630 [Heracleum sosnowskyi]|uniref:Uncharacterized protein n=1 Tax=Heracleum sosnowskyi TaxID=360622 RepID=A0AAD8MZI1_9APIA|nr:hypothetical protein POM88_018630 [Heracleum sosnowskyi]
MSMIELLRAAVAQDKKYVALDDGKGSYGVVFSVIDTIPTLCDNLRIIKLALALGMEQQKRYAFMYSLRCFQGFALSTFLNVHFVEVYFGVLTLLDAASSEGMKADEEQDGDNA